MAKSWVLGAAVVLSAAGPGVAQMVDPADPQTVIAALQTLGYKATLEPDSSGEPRVRSAIEGTNYSVWFYGCTDKADCSALNFSTGFDLEQPLDMAVVNDWNTNKLVGRVYLDETGDPFIDYFIEAEGGLPTETFASAVARWGVAIEGFKEAINW